MSDPASPAASLPDVAGVAGPLAGVRILDLSSVVMGPYATQQLGDLGADVIVVEDRSGDTNRYMSLGPVPGLSGTSLNLMRNKRSVRLDLKQDEGREALLAIAATCDVMITNLRPGPLGRLGLTYEDVRAVRDDIVFCQAQGFPSDSDRAEAPAYDDIIQSAAGIPDLFVRQGHEPSLMPTLIADKVCGMAVQSAVLAALFHRATTGEGQRVEVPMVDVMTSFVLVEHGGGGIPEPASNTPGHLRILTSWRKPQPTADGFVHILPYHARHYQRIFEAGGRPDLAADDTRFVDRPARFANSDSLYQSVAELTQTRTTADWLAICDADGIPATAVATLDGLLDALRLVEHPVAGSMREIPHPVRYSATPASVRRPAPLCGENTSEVLAEVGFAKTAIEGLRATDAAG